MKGVLELRVQAHCYGRLPRINNEAKADSFALDLFLFLAKVEVVALWLISGREIEVGRPQFNHEVIAHSFPEVDLNLHAW